MTLVERFATDGVVICAQGYLFELERRGYLQAGPFVPEVVLTHPDVVAQLHREYLRAGSDVVEALTYYAHREKLRRIGRERDLETLNRQALAIAHDVASEHGERHGRRPLVAGNISNTNVWAPDRSAQVRAMFDEQVAWAADSGVDYVIAETFSWLGEALVAVDAVKATGLEVAATLTIDRDPHTRDGWAPLDACRALADRGADVVGLNCARGPATMLPLIEEVAPALDRPVAALPVPYRTTEAQPSKRSLRDPLRPDELPFPTGLDPFTCTRYEMADFAERARAAGVVYLGLCCGAGPHHVRALAEAVGRQPEAGRYDPDMRRHDFLGDEVTNDQRRSAQSR